MSLGMSAEDILHAVMTDALDPLHTMPSRIVGTLSTVDALVHEGHLEWRCGIDGMQCLAITDAGRERVTRWLDPGTRADMGLEVQS